MTLVLSLQRTSVLLRIIAVIQLKLLTLQVTNEGEHKKYKTYPSLGSRASPRGEVRLSDIRAIRHLPSRSDTSIWSVCISFQYKLPPIQSTASPLRNKLLSTSCQAKLPNFHVRVDNKETKRQIQDNNFSKQIISWWRKSKTILIDEKKNETNNFL